MNPMYNIERTRWLYGLVAPRTSASTLSLREVERAVNQAKGSNHSSRRRWSGACRRRWWRRGARTYEEMKFKWFPVIYNHGVAYYIDFQTRDFREVNNPQFRITFGSKVGKRMVEEARRQGVRFGGSESDSDRGLEGQFSRDMSCAKLSS